MAGNISASNQVLEVSTTSALDRTLWSAQASHNSGAAQQGIDSSISTRWSSGSAQAKGMWYQLDTGPGDKTYNKLEMKGNGDYARYWEIRVSSDGADWSEPIAAGTGSSGDLSVGFAEQTARYLRIILTGSAGVYWSIYDMNLYGTAAPDHEPPSQPSGLAVSGVLDTQLDLAWNASTDNMAVAGYHIYEGSSMIASVTSTAYRHSQRCIRVSGSSAQ